MDRNNSQPDVLELKDIAVAAYLYSTHQVKLLGKRRLPTGDILLQFSPRAKAEELIKLYWNLEAPIIQPKLLFNAQRDLKDIIFGG